MCSDLQPVCWRLRQSDRLQVCWRLRQSDLHQRLHLRLEESANIRQARCIPSCITERHSEQQLLG